MILGKKDNERVRNLESILIRFHDANRWLSEFDDMLGPMWDYIMGKTETITLPNGERLELMKNGEVSDMRSKLRTAVHFAIDTRATNREKTP